MASSAFTRVACSLEHNIYYKEYLPRSPAESIKALLRGSRARRAQRNGEALLRAGIDTPHILQHGKLSAGREYLFTTAAPGLGVTHWLRGPLAEGSRESLKQRWQLLHELGIFVGRLHANGFIHGDLRPNNVLADYQQERFRFTLIDNERNARKKPPPGTALLRNLTQLNMLTPTELTRSDRLRFFLAWHRQMRELSSAEATILATEAYQWAQRRLQDKGELRKS